MEAGRNRFRERFQRLLLSQIRLLCLKRGNPPELSSPGCFAVAGPQCVMGGVAPLIELLQNQHAVAIAVKPVFLSDGVLVCT